MNLKEQIKVLERMVVEQKKLIDKMQKFPFTVDNSEIEDINSFIYKSKSYCITDQGKIYTKKSVAYGNLPDELIAILKRDLFYEDPEYT